MSRAYKLEKVLNQHFYKLLSIHGLKVRGGRSPYARKKVYEIRFDLCTGSRERKE